MFAVTEILNAAKAGDRRVAQELLPIVYQELRKLAAARLAGEKPGQTLQATALVHEAYLRLVGSGRDQDWNSRGHFFAAAAEAMRRILIEQARLKHSEKCGGGRVRVPLEELELAVLPNSDDLLDLNEALTALACTDRLAADLVKLRYFAGMTIPETAAALGMAPRTADATWAYARAWLHKEIEDQKSSRG